MPAALTRREKLVNPNNALNMQKFDDSAEWSKRQLRFQLERRMEAIRQYVGHRYSESGADFEVPLPMMNMMVDTFARELTSDAPVVDVTSLQSDDDSIVMADDLRLGINYSLMKANVGDVYARMAVSSMFGPSMVKIGLDPGYFTGQNRRAMSLPFALEVQAEDMLIDMLGRDEEELWYVGNDYQVPLEWAQEYSEFNKQAREDLTVDEMYPERFKGDTRPEVFSRGEGGSEAAVDTVWLRDRYLPLQNLVVTTQVDSSGKKPLLVREWEGPDNHPLAMYKLLRFGYVPGNLLPLAPAHIMLDLHELINAIFNKSADDMLNSKTILAVDMASMDDGENAIAAKHAQLVPMANLNGMKEVNFRGPDSGANGIVVYLRDMFSYYAGNLDLAAGLGTQSPTATQDKLLTQGANKKLVFMQKQMAKLQSEVAKDFGWYLYNDPSLRIPLKKEVAGMEIPFILTPQRMKGDYYSLNFRVDPYTLAPRSPEERLASIFAILDRLAPVLQQAQLTLHPEKLASIASKLSNNPEINGLIQYPNGRSQRESPPKAAPIGGTKHTIRHTAPTVGSRAGREQAIASAMLGAKQQPKQQAVIGRN